MPLMEWTAKLAVGIKVLDDDHKRLVGMVNELYDSMKAGHGKEMLGKTLNDLIAYTKMHFAREEQFFAQTRYPDAVKHRQEHDALTRQAVEIQQKYSAGAASALSIEVLVFQQRWLTHHIQGSDQKYSQHLYIGGIR